MANLEEKITIEKSYYEQLVKDSNFLKALEACGVDNWECYSDAYEMVKNDT